MQITLFSFFIATGWSSLFTLLIYFFQKKYISMSFFSVMGLLQLNLFCILRMLLPLEMPFTKVVSFQGIYASIIYFFNQPIKVLRNRFTITIGGIILVFWLLSSLFLLVRLYCCYVKTKNEIKLFHEIKDTNVYRVLELIKEKNKKKFLVDVRKSPFVKVPMSFGIIKKFIILPMIEYEEKELYFILLHEYTHLANGDLKVKLMICILRCIYWWNPCVYLLNKELNQTLEIKCDLTVIKDMNKNQQADYLSAIVTSIKQAGSNDRKINRKAYFIGTANLLSKNELEIKERFELIYRYGDKRDNIRGKAIMSIIFLLMFCLSYIVVLQPEFQPPLEEIEAKENIYKIETEEVTLEGDGAYKIELPDGRRIKVCDETILKMKEISDEASSK